METLKLVKDEAEVTLFFNGVLEPNTQLYIYDSEENYGGYWRAGTYQSWLDDGFVKE